MESLTIVHPDTNTPVGTLPRAEAIQTGAWCRSTNIFVMNTKGEILCHQRSMQKERRPGFWFTHLGGHVGSDESYESNALKELAEESGIVVNAEELIPWRTTKIDYVRLWVREFVVLVDEDRHQLVPQPGEVEKFSWMSLPEILKASKTNNAKWKAGTHNFHVEYHCLKAALTVAYASGKLKGDIDLHTWHPVQA